MTDLVREAVKARFPELAPVDALQFLELERGLDRSIAETDAAFATRLKEAWARWALAGSARSVLKALKDQGYSNTEIEVVQANGLRWTIAAGVDDTTTSTAIPAPFSAWITDGDTAFWSKFVVLLKDTPPGPNWFTAAHATFTAETVKTVTFPTPFLDATYNVLTGIHSTSATPLVKVTAKTANGFTMTTDASFTGSIDSLAWAGNDFPLVSPTSSEFNKLCRIIDRWKAGRAVFIEFVTIVRGHYYGEVGLDWGDGGLVYGPAAPGEPITIKMEC
jgi:hypothetical protein